MSKYGYAGKVLERKLKEEARQKKLEEERQENSKFCVQLIWGGCCFGLVFAVMLLYSILSSGNF